MNKQSIYKFSENTLSLFSIKAVELGLTIWLIPYLILKVGLANYGRYAFAMAFILFFVNVLNYGFNLSTVRELVKNKNNPAKINALFNEVISVKLVLFGALYLFVLGLIVLIPEFWAHKQLYFYTSLLLVGEFFSLRWFFMGMEQMKFKSFINLSSTFIYILLLLLFIQVDDDYIYIPLYEAIAVISVSISAFFWVVKKHQMTLKILSFKEISHYLKVNFSSFINLLLPSTYGTIIVFLVGLLGVPTYVSFMQIGVKFTGAFGTANTVITKVCYPLVNRNEKLRGVTSLLLLSIGVVLSISMYVSAPFLLSNWLHFEHATQLAETIFMVQLLSPIPFLMGVVSSYGINGLLTFYKDILYLKITVIATLAMLLMAGLLIPPYHFYGGAIALLVGRFVYAGLAWYSFKKVKRHV